MVKSGSRFTAHILLLILTLLLTSCTVRLVASYDEVIDRTATELQEDMDRHLTNLVRHESTPQAAYDANTDFYSEYAVRLRSIRVRASAHPMNEKSIEQIRRMESMLDSLEEQHKRGHLSSATTLQTRELFSKAWAAIIALEMAKKRGET